MKGFCKNMFDLTATITSACIQHYHLVDVSITNTLMLDTCIPRIIVPESLNHRTKIPHAFISHVVPHILINIY